MRRGLGVIDCFDRLRHDAIIRGDNQHDDVRDVRATGAHRGERGVTRGINKRNFVSVVLDAIRADVLRDSAGFTRSEERRVGKECRTRWSRYSLKKKETEIEVT